MKFPGVGVAAIIVKDGKVLMAKRRKAPGIGCWQFPGGKLELNEDPRACAVRESFEEAGVKVSAMRFAGVTNDVFRKEKKHYVTLFFVCAYVSGRARMMEPEKSGEWSWFEWRRLPKPLFPPVQDLVRKQRFNPFSQA